MAFDSYLKKVGKNIQGARKRLKFTQEDMANKGFNYRYYQKIEVNLNFGTKLAQSDKQGVNHGG